VDARPVRNLQEWKSARRTSPANKCGLGIGERRSKNNRGTVAQQFERV